MSGQGNPDGQAGNGTSDQNGNGGTDDKSNANNGSGQQSSGAGADSSAQNSGSDDKSGGSGKPADDKSGDWQAKFEGQQKVNRDLESKLNQLRDGLKSALGVEDKKSDPLELVSGLQKQLEQFQHDQLVSTVARRHGITKDDDLAFLRDAKDEAAMNKLAERLKPSGEDKNDKTRNSGKPGTPRPDRSQSSSSRSGGGNGSDRKAGSIAEVRAQRAAERAAKASAKQ